MKSESVHPARVVILAAVDGTPESDQVITTAAGLARALPGGELHVLHVVEVVPRDPAVAAASYPNASELLESARTMVEQATKQATATFGAGARVLGHVATGTPWREIVDMAANVEADLIVVGTHDNHGLKRLLLGSVAEQVAKNARAAVLIARKKDYDVPAIEPPCPDCVEVQRATGGETMWCERHTRRHPHGHLHYETPPTYGVGAMFIRP